MIWTIKQYGMESGVLFTNWFNIRFNSDLRFVKKSTNILDKKIQNTGQDYKFIARREISKLNSYVI